MRVDHCGAVVVLVLGAGASYFLTQASPEALAVTSKALMAAGLVGLVLLAAMVAVRLLTARGDGGRGRGDDQPIPVRPMDDLDAELFRIIDEERLARSSAPPS